ncbi:trichohyalin-like isoform X2 [Platichthys flesus]|uniref:trichohyalin-like isoform X2 n=1 Tax=Platichthys flesus TaxID=8260 RepID=UPI002DB6095C|nr:trichohyalin-like isoform X2 [Platichthys flesus]
MSLADLQWCPTSVQVTVLQARGLRVKGKGGTNDAYAVMHLGKEKYQTSVVEKSVAPVWKEEAAFDLPPLLLLHQGAGGGGGGGGAGERGTLRVHVLHRALVGPDKQLGQAVINLLQLSDDKTRSKTEWFKLLDKTGKADKDRGEVLVDIQFMRNNMTASMFDLSAAGKSRSRLGKFKDKVRGKKKDSDAASGLVPSFSHVLTDSEGDEEVPVGKDEKKKKQKMKSLFSSKSNLQKNMSQSMSVLPVKNSSLSGSQSSGLNMDSSEGKKKFKFKIPKRSGSSDGKDSSSSNQKHGAAEQSNLCINGSHVYREERQTRTSRIGSNFSLASSGHGSMEDVPESSPPSVESLQAVRQYSAWTEEEEEEEETAEVEHLTEDMEEHRKDEEEIVRMEEERRRRKEDDRKQEEAVERLAEQKRRQEEEERKRIEEEKVRREEEERLRKQEEALERLAEEKRQEEEERKRIEEEKVRREEEERLRKKEEALERLAEEKRQEEEERKRIEEEKVKREEEQRLRSQEEALERLAEEKRRQEEERKRIEEEEKVRLEKEQMIMRKRLEEEEQVRREEQQQRERLEEEKKRCEEQKRRVKEEEKVQEERMRREEECRLAQEKRKMEDERMIEEERRRKEEEQMRRRELEECEAKRKLQDQEKMQQEEEERIRKEEERRQEEEERAKKEKEEYERLAEERRKLGQKERERMEDEERIKREKDMRMEVDKRREEEEAERVRREVKEKRRLEEQERRIIEEAEKRKREEAERIMQEDRARKEKEEYEKLVEEKRKLEEQERQEEERIRHEEEEKIKIEEERRRKAGDEERAKKEEMERLAEEKKRLEEQEKRRIEEEGKILREEEERKRRLEEAGREKREEEARKLEPEKLKDAEIQKKKENTTKEGHKAAGKKPRVAEESPAGVTCSNPFDETGSSDPSEDVPDSPAAPDSRASQVSKVKQGYPSAVSSVGSGTRSTDQRDLIGAQRDKRPAPQPPRGNVDESQREPDVSKPHQAQTNKQSNDKDLKTASVLPQRSVQVIAPLSRSRADTKNSQSSMQGSDAKGAGGLAKHSKRPAPSRPSVEEELSSKPKSPSVSEGGVPETKQAPVVYSSNPFEDDEDEPTGQDDSPTPGSVHWPPAASQDAASQAKLKSSKMARAPAPPPASSTLAQQNTDGGHVTDTAGVAAPDKGAKQTRAPQPEVKISASVQDTSLKEPQPARAQSTAEVTGVKKEGPPPTSRRLQPVKPLNPQEQNPAPVQSEKNNNSTEIEKKREVQDKTKVNDGGPKGPYTQLTQKELISLVLKQEKQLSERDKTIAELELYIDNLLVRVIEESPDILMSLNSLKRTV